MNGSDMAKHGLWAILTIAVLAAAICAAAAFGKWDRERSDHAWEARERKRARIWAEEAGRLPPGEKR